MKIIGLTGGIACGKSTVSAYLKQRGAAIIDGDAIAKELSAPGRSIWRAYKEHFGSEILNADSSLNRRLIGQKVFTDEAEKNWMNKTMQPLIKAEIIRRIKECESSGTKVAVLDVPLLFEAGWHTLADEVWVVAVDRALQIARIKERDGLSEAEAISRIDAQMPAAEKARRADVVIDSSHPIEITQAKVKEICLERHLDLN